MPLVTDSKKRKSGGSSDGPKKAKAYALKSDVRFKVSTALNPPTAYDDKVTYDWRDFLEIESFNTLPVQCFPTAPLHEVWVHMCTGMKMEVPNKDYVATRSTGVYWVASVTRFAGYKILLRYEGMDQDHSSDFWMNLCSKDVHPIGWCANKSQPLVAPKAVQETHAENKTVQDWKSFLCKRLTGARTLPMEFHERVMKGITCQFRVGMHVELADRAKLSQVRPATVKEVTGHRLCIEYDEPLVVPELSEDETDEFENEFWCHFRSPLLHPVGWAIRVGHKIECSKAYREACEKKIANGKYDSDDATPDIFPKLPPSSDDKNLTDFEPGMKLEAIDPLDLSSIVVASVTEVLHEGFIMIQFDGTSDSFCYHKTSPSIFPTGFCETNKIPLEPLKGATQKFSWPEYLQQTKSTAAPHALFQTDLVQHKFKCAMKAECTDLMNPRLVCVATVSEVKGRLLRIHFDGWENAFDQWVDCYAPDLFPVGYCEMMGCKLEPPKADEPPVPPKKKTKTPTSGTKKGAKK